MGKDISCDIKEIVCETAINDDRQESIILGVISWNGRDPKGYDIRKYSREHKKAYAGVSLTHESMEEIIKSAIRHGCCNKDEISLILAEREAKVFCSDRFESMFERVSNADSMEDLKKQSGMIRIRRRRI